MFLHYHSVTPRFHALSVVLLLVFFGFFPGVGGVCQSCFGRAAGCPGTGAADCPWVKDVASNAAILVGAAAGALKLAALLPQKVLWLFSRPVLDTLASIALRPKLGQSFDPAGKSHAAVVQAVSAGHLTREEGVIHFSTLLSALDMTKEDDRAKGKSLQSFISVVQGIKVKGSVGAVEGEKLFILAKLSRGICGATRYERASTLRFATIRASCAQRCAEHQGRTLPPALPGILGGA